MSSASQPYTGRFAPSPTGRLHLGNLRTAMLAWLFARAQGGRFLVRMEDLDPERVVPAMEEQQLADLAALGLDWDEPPVRQSERRALYDDALARLTERDLVYRCFCTRADIREAASAPHGLPPGGYPGTCAMLDQRTVERRLDAGQPWCLRARAHDAQPAFDDRLLGHVTAAVDDFVLVRKDGVPAYNLAVVVDDAAQQVTEVVRGADLADSTPRQLWLAQALGLPAPSYAHVPLMLGHDGSRLSKRHGSVTIADWQAAGRSVADVRGFLARSLGLAHEQEQPTLVDLLDRFDPEALPSSDTIVDVDVVHTDV